MIRYLMMIRMIGCIIKVKKVVEILITKEVGEINLSICKDIWRQLVILRSKRSRF